ncbi:MAG: hypothetical protein RL177_30 [Bacteroidota bacterium]
MKSLLLLLLCCAPLVASAQTTLTGVVRDAKSNEPLTAATLQVAGTYRGTVSNSDGQFEITVPSFPATLYIRFIGYNTDTLRIESAPQGPIVIRLRPSEFQLREIVVTGDDPALDIMRRVIQNKREWRANLFSYQAEAYTRQRLENDTSIVSISESLSDAYWDVKRGTREVIRYKQQTSNIDPSSNFAAATFIPNLYDDNITISGFELVGPTHPDALDFYHFKLDGFRQQDGVTVFDILISPKRRLQPTFVGKISVLDEAFPIQEFGLHYIQQFSNYGTQFWLPVDVRIEGTIEIGFPGLRFPPFKFNQQSRLDNYVLNMGLPDSLFQNTRRLTVDSLSVARGNLNPRIGMAIPLDARERQAYDTVDSTMTIDKAFRPSGPLARFVTVNDGDDEPAKPKTGLAKYISGLSPDLYYNKVAGAHLGIGYTPEFLKLPVDVSVGGGYNTIAEKAFYNASLSKGVRRPLMWSLTYSYGIESAYRESMYPQWMTSAIPLITGNDYHRVYVSERVEAGLTYRSGRGIPVRDRRRTTGIRPEFGLGVIQDRAASYETVRAVRAHVSTAGNAAPFGITGQKNIRLDIEHANELFSSDITYTRYHVEIDHRFETWLRRRFLPNVLDVKLIAGTATGTLPVYKTHVVDGSLSAFTPFGGLRTLRSAAYEANDILALHWEHHFRTVPFEWIGWDAAVDKGIGVIVFGSSAQTWRPKHTHHEIGASVSGLFSVMRVDVAYRLDQPGFFAGLSLARIF